MTSEDRPVADPTEAFVWVWLPGAGRPVVAGRLIDRGAVTTFTYGLTYLARSDAIPLYLPELPLERGEQSPRSGTLPGCIADAGPDAWGQRVIEHRRLGAATDLRPLVYLLESGSDRIGALDFQASSETYQPRISDRATLEDLAEAADLVERGSPLTPALDQILLHASSIGGARPKAVLDDGRRTCITKFSSTTDSYPVVKAEYIAMELAHRAGLNVPGVKIQRVLDRDVLIIERFDRLGDGTRRLMVSALTILDLHDAAGIAGRYGSYVDLADHVRAEFVNADTALRELFSRITFNVLVGNTDDHPRNHSAFWDGENLSLTPAYDICPQPRAGGEVRQAMAFGSNGDRFSQVIRCVAHAPTYHLAASEARDIVDRQLSTVHEEWDDVCDRAEATEAERERLWGRQFLNPYALYDY